MVGDIWDFENDQEVFLDFDFFDYFCGSVIVEDEFSWRMVFKVVGKGKFAVLDHIIMAQ